MPRRAQVTINIFRQLILNIFHREVCQNIFTNPRTVPTVKTVKYCTIPEPGAEAAAEADLDLRNTASAGEDEVLQLQRQPKSQRQGNRRVPVQV